MFPAALYFGAPYAESLFLLVSVGAFYAARTGSWAWAGACAAAASATRSAGLLLVIPLAMLWWTSAERRPRDAAWLLLAPLGVAAYAAWLGLAEGDALRFLDIQDAWHRDFSVPLAGAWDGLGAAWDGLRQLASGSRSPVYFEQAAGDPFRIAALNIMLFASLLFALVALVGIFRRLAPAYGAWVGASLVLPLSFPVGPAAPDVPAALPGGSVPDLHVAGAGVRGAAVDRPGGRPVRAGARPVLCPVRELALDRVTTQAVLLDALGTLVELQPPAPRLRALLEAEGFSVSPERATAGFRAEIAYYLAHHLEGSDRAALDDLRDRCAAVLREALELPGLDGTQARAGRCWGRSNSALRGRRAVLSGAARTGMTLVVCQQLGLSLRDRLGHAGSPSAARRGHLRRGRRGQARRGDFVHALTLAGAPSREARFTSVTRWQNDVAGARAAGIGRCSCAGGEAPSGGRRARPARWGGRARGPISSEGDVQRTRPR